MRHLGCRAFVAAHVTGTSASSLTAATTSTSTGIGTEVDLGGDTPEEFRERVSDDAVH
jgi:hypothetical protein